MNIFLSLLLVAAMIATVIALVRGIVTFLKESSAQVQAGNGPNPMAVKSNRMMQARVFFQALAILIVVLIAVIGSRA